MDTPSRLESPIFRSKATVEPKIRLFGPGFKVRVWRNFRGFILRDARKSGLLRMTSRPSVRSEILSDASEPSGRSPRPHGEERVFARLEPWQQPKHSSP
jgi:hypothetical protein